MRAIKNYIIILFLLAAVISCKKKGEIKLDDSNLTACETAATCSYLFTENADLTEEWYLKQGSYRVFIAQANYEPWVSMERAIIVKAPMQGNSFELTDNAIKNGAVIYKSICPVCFSIDYKPIGGLIKGVNATPDKPVNESKWLIEANIILVSDQNENQILRDTIHFKQYFSANL